MAQQMYHQSEIQKFEGVIQTLVSEMKEMQQEDEGSEIRIQELERQRDTACLAMQHMNSVNQGMKNDFELAVARINEQSQAQRHQDYIVTEELLQRLHEECNETAQNLAHIEERSQGDGVVMAKEYEMLTSELHTQAKDSLRCIVCTMHPGLTCRKCQRIGMVFFLQGASALPGSALAIVFFSMGPWGWAPPAVALAILC